MDVIQNKWIDNYQIHSYEVDVNRKLTLESLCRIFQESAWNHAENLHFGYSNLKETNKIWVLSRLAIEIYRMPFWGEQVELHTWPRKFQSLHAFREFEIYDKDGQRIIGGSSAWLVIDAASRRPQRAEKYLSNVLMINQCSISCIDPPKLDGNGMAGEALVFRTAYSDIDMNRHVNNARYAAWFFNTYSLDFHNENQLKSVAINYMLEVSADEEVAVYTNKKDQMVFEHSIWRLRDNTELCRISATWEKRQIT